MDGEEEDVLRRINFRVTVYSTFLRGTGWGWFNLFLFWMVTSWAVKKVYELLKGLRKFFFIVY